MKPDDEEIMTRTPFENLTANVEQRLLGMKFSKPNDDYDLGYNDAVDDAMRAFAEAMEEVKEETA